MLNGQPYYQDNLTAIFCTNPIVRKKVVIVIEVVMEALANGAIIAKEGSYFQELLNVNQSYAWLCLVN